MLPFFISGQSFDDSIRQINYNFHPPLNIELVLAGNFGELRRNHFHTGLDFKTQRREGLPVYAIEYGHVSRIKSGPWGYGKVIYIDHPQHNLTSVYAHLKKFPKNIERFLQEAMVQNQENEIDIYPGKDQLPVNKGEIIGISGNTGGSTAPHLHFEVRITDTEHPINPLLLNFKVEDHKPPQIFGLKFYTIDSSGFLSQQRSLYYYSGNNNEKKISLPSDFVKEHENLVVGIDAVDFLDAAGNKCGIYEAILKDGKDSLFYMKLDQLSFSNNRYINCHMDYESYKKERKNIHKMYLNPINQLGIYGNNKSLFNSPLKPNKKYTIQLKDVYGNTTQFHFEVDYDSSPAENLTSTKLDPRLPHFLKGEKYTIVMPAHCFYEPLKSKIQVKEGTYSPEVNLGEADIPIHKYFDISIKPNKNLPEIDLRKFFIYSETSRGYKRSHSTYYADGSFHAKVRDFGLFSVAIDTIPPTITNKNFKNESTTGRSHLFFSISDNFSGVHQYDAYINGTWTIMEYEPKRGGSYQLDISGLEKGKHEIKIKAVDLCGNTALENYLITTN